MPIIYRWNEGNVALHGNALQFIVEKSAMRCPGVNGLVSPNWKSGLRDTLRIDRSGRGVNAYMSNGTLVVDAFVCIETGFNMLEVCKNLQRTIALDLNHMLGIEKCQTNVHVQKIIVRRN